MTTPKEWLVDIAEAADELGAHIRSIAPDRVELYWGNDVTVAVESVFLSGRLLKRILRPLVESAPDETAAASYGIGDAPALAAASREARP